MIMVSVKYLCLVIPLFIQEVVSRAQEAVAVASTESPPGQPDYGTGSPKSYGDYDYGSYDYGKQYDDYVKQYKDYVNQYGGDQYGDYGAIYTTDYGIYDHTWQYEDDYGYYDDDYSHDLGDYFGFGDRGNPLDTLVHVHDETGAQSQMPWVYIIVPVVQIDVFYVDDEHKDLENVEFQLPIETFLFELGDFGMGHFDLGSFGIGELDHLVGDYGDYGHQGADISDYGLVTDYAQYSDYPLYGNYPNYGAKAVDMYAPADELPDAATLDYPGIDHEPYWVDWIFMIPPDEMGLPIIR